MPWTLSQGLEEYTSYDFGLKIYGLAFPLDSESEDSRSTQDLERWTYSYGLNISLGL